MLKFTIQSPILKKTFLLDTVEVTLWGLFCDSAGFSLGQVLWPSGGETPATKQRGVKAPLPRGSAAGSPCEEGEEGGGGADTSPWNPIRQRDSASRWGVQQGLGLPRGAALVAHWVSHDRSLFPKLWTSLGSRRAPLRPQPYNASNGQSRGGPGQSGMGTVRPCSSVYCLSFFVLKGGFSLARIFLYADDVIRWYECGGWIVSLLQGSDFFFFF